MDIQQALIVFDALSQETRLRAFRLLVRAGTEGLAAGSLSEQLGTPHNTLSFHLTHLSNAGVVSSRKQGRSVIYTANFDLTHDLIGFMVKDCCSDEFARRVSEREDLSDTLEQFAQFDGPAFLEVMVDPDALVMPMVGPGKGYKDMIVGDYMTPRGTPDPKPTGIQDTSAF